MMSALFLLRENRDFIDPNIDEQMYCIRQVCTQILKDLIYEIAQNPSYLSPIESINSQIESILDFVLEFDPTESKIKKDDSKRPKSRAFSEKEEI